MKCPRCGEDITDEWPDEDCPNCGWPGRLKYPKKKRKKKRTTLSSKR